MRGVKADFWAFRNRVALNLKYLIEGSDPLGELGFDLGQRLCPLKCLLELLLGLVQAFL